MAKKKKTYFVKCTVNMCANEERSVIVKATKEMIAHLNKALIGLSPMA